MNQKGHQVTWRITPQASAPTRPRKLVADDPREERVFECPDCSAALVFVCNDADNLIDDEPYPKCLRCGQLMEEIDAEMLVADAGRRR